LRELRQQAFLRGDLWHERRLDAALGERRRGSGTDRSDRRKRPARTPQHLARRERARHDDPVVALDVELFRPDRLQLDQRAAHDVVPERLEPAGERLELLSRARDDHAQPLRGGSHP
jgi:hypothetical protein